MAKVAVTVHLDAEVLDFIKEGIREKRWNSVAHAIREALHWFITHAVTIQPSDFKEIGGKQHGKT